MSSTGPWAIGQPRRAQKGRRVRPLNWQGDGVELGVGAQRHAAPGRDVPPADQAPRGARLLGGVQEAGVGLEASRHHRRDAGCERPEALGDPVGLLDSTAPARRWPQLSHGAMIAPSAYRQTTIIEQVGDFARSPPTGASVRSERLAAKTPTPAGRRAVEGDRSRKEH
jgi:hypothetical protein